MMKGGDGFGDGCDVVRGQSACFRSVLQGGFEPTHHQDVFDRAGIITANRFEAQTIRGFDDCRQPQIQTRRSTPVDAQLLAQSSVSLFPG